MRDHSKTPSKLTPSQAADRFLSEALERAKRASERSKYRTTLTLFLSENGEQWPGEERIASFRTLVRVRFTNLGYANALVRVMLEWRDWLIGQGIWTPGKDADAPHVSALEPALMAVSESGAGVRLDHASVSLIAEAVRETVFGSEPSQDYWAAVMRHVAGSVGTSGIAKLFQLDPQNCERLIASRKVPRHLQKSIQQVHAALILRQSDLEPEDVWDRLYALEASVEA